MVTQNNATCSQATLPRTANFGRTWTKEIPSLPEKMPSGIPWPRVSVVTPSFNQGQFLEETIRSVLWQGYPNLEYIVIDGGSIDESVEVIKKYESRIGYWVSEPDQGQASAINKGWAMVQGELITWLNADDVLLPGQLAWSVMHLVENPTSDLVFGNVTHIDSDSNKIGERFGREFSLEYVLTNWHNIVPQPGFLMRRSVINRIGLLDETLHFAMDFDYWLRLALHGGILHYSGEFLAGARMHQATKTSQIKNIAAEEQIVICNKIFSLPGLPQSVRKLEKRSFGAAFASAAYWSYLANDAAGTRRYASRALRYPSRRLGMAGKLWLIGLTGEHLMQSLRSHGRKLSSLKILSNRTV